MSLSDKEAQLEQHIFHSGFGFVWVFLINFDISSRGKSLCKHER